MRGVEILRIFAPSVRGDQDFGLKNNDSSPVGDFRVNATPAEVLATIRGWQREPAPGSSPTP
jgi:hypothetical protein